MNLKFFCFIFVLSLRVAAPQKCLLPQPLAKSVDMSLARLAGGDVRLRVNVRGATGTLRSSTPQVSTQAAAHAALERWSPTGEYITRVRRDFVGDAASAGTNNGIWV